VIMKIIDQFNVHKHLLVRTWTFEIMYFLSFLVSEGDAFMEDDLKSDSEESRPRRTRYPTVRFVDQALNPLRSRSLLRKKKRVQ